MNTNMDKVNTNLKENNKTELSINEMEAVSGGILPLALAYGTIALGGLLIYLYKK